MIYRILSILICGVFSIGCLAQRVKTVGGEYTYVAPKNMSPEEAERVAFERLKTKLIAEEFGTVVSQTNLTKVENQNGQSNIDFSSYGGSEVKGEWIETVKGPHFENGFVDGLVVVKVSARGKIREIVSSKVEFDSRVLRNGTEDRYEADRFREGDDLYISFAAPVDGYVAAYLIDNENTAYCLLPYKGQKEGNVRVEVKQALRLRLGGLRSAGGETDRGRILHDLLAAAGGQPGLCGLLAQRLLQEGGLRNRQGAATDAISRGIPGMALGLQDEGSTDERQQKDPHRDEEIGSSRESSSDPRDQGYRVRMGRTVVK